MSNARQELTRAEPQESTWDGYCKHGVYVGGCGADFMCSECENE